MLLAPALAGLTTLLLLASACGSTSPGVAAVATTITSSRTTSSPSAGLTAMNAGLAFSRCMRLHGVPNFPDPDSRGSFPPLTQQALGVSKQTSLTAQQACEHFLSSGGSIGTPQDRGVKFAFALNVARCLRTHGFHRFSDPIVSSQGTSQNLSGAGIDPNSPQFQTAQTTCEKQARRTLGLS